MKSIYYYCGDPASRWDLILLDRRRRRLAGGEQEELHDRRRGLRGRPHRRAARILGNLDAVGVLQDADEAGLRREIARRSGRRAAATGSFVMSIGSPVTPDTPVERVRLYCEMARGLGSNG